MNNKKSFTLIELLISIALTAIIMVFLYQSMHNVNKTNKFYEKRLDNYSKKNELVFLLYNDILSSKQHDTSVTKTAINNNVVLFIMKSKHSIKGFSNPYVSYVLIKKKKVLFRLETTTKPILPMSQEDIFRARANIFNNVSAFSVHQNKKEFLIYYIYRDKKEFFALSTL